MKAANLYHMKFAYIAALVVIASLTIAGHFINASIIGQHTATTDAINKSVEIKRLTDKVSGYAERYARGEVSIGPAILEDARLLESNYRSLRYSDTAYALRSETSDAIRAIRSEGENSLDRKLGDFLKTAFIIPQTDYNRASLQFRVQLLSSYNYKSINLDLDRILAMLKETNSEQIERLKHFQLISIAAILAALLLTGLCIFRPMVQRIQDHVARLEHLATTDQLTNLLNLHKFRDRSLAELNRAKDLKLQTCLMMLDIDKFKNINDSYGHMVGDKVIQKFADTMRMQLRETDVIARVGGEEFAVVLVDTNLRAAEAIAERLRKAISAAIVDTDEGQVCVSASIGLAHFPAGETELEETLKAADDALYAAKNADRNKVVVAGPKGCRVNEPASAQKNAQTGARHRARAA